MAVACTSEASFSLEPGHRTFCPTTTNMREARPQQRLRQRTPLRQFVRGGCLVAVSEASKRLGTMLIVVGNELMSDARHKQDDIHQDQSQVRAIVVVVVGLPNVRVGFSRAREALHLKIFNSVRTSSAHPPSKGSVPDG